MSKQKTEDEKLLETEADAWKPDAELEAAAEGETLEAGTGTGALPEPETPAPSVTLIGDPFGIKTLEISEAQESSEELDLDGELLDEDFEEEGDLALQDVTSAEAVEQMESLARAVAAAEAEQVREAEKAAADAGETFDAEAELKRQIAEDEALAREMEQEAQNGMTEQDPELLAALPKEPQADADGNLDLSEMESCIETLLFMSDKPVSIDRLKEYLGPAFDKAIFEQAVERLQARYQAPNHGIEVVAVGHGYQFRTKPGRAALAKKLARIQMQRLSSGAMESLAIVAYKQPVMKEDIDKIRGVDSSYFIRGLLDRKLIKIAGRSELPGRPMLYATTDEFLQIFGLKDLSSMPPLRELEQMIPASESKNPDDEDPRVKEMRKLVMQMKSDTSTTLKYDPREDEKILKEIRERVSAIPTSTPYLEEQKALEKAAQGQATQGPAPAQPELPVQEAAPAPAEAPALEAPAEAAPASEDAPLA
jgi:segregation and condensation protein B